jgi:hypothetical protein
MQTFTPNTYYPGQAITLSARIFGKGVLTDPATVTLTLHAPTFSGVADVVVTPTRDTQGRYHYDYVLPMDSPAGPWVSRWQTTGTSSAQNGLVERPFLVAPLKF